MTSPLYEAAEISKDQEKFSVVYLFTPWEL